MVSASCTIVSQARQRQLRADVADHLEAGDGTYSQHAHGRSSWPMRLNTSADRSPGRCRLPHGSCDGLARQVWRQRLADRMLAFHVRLTGCPASASPAVSRASAAPASASSSPDQQLRLLDRVVELLGRRRPKRARRNTASCIFSFSDM